MSMIIERERLTPLELKPEQQAAVSTMVEELWATGGALNASEMGTGKTVMLVETAFALGAQTILISAPLHTRFGWQDTVMRQANGDVPFLWINNNTKAGKAAMESLRRGDAGFYFIGRELFRLSDWRGMKIDLVVHDECQTIANRNNKGYKVAFDLRSRTRYTVCQSATWYGSDFQNAWGIGRVLWPEVVERNFYRWVLKFCKTVRDPFSPQGNKVVGERYPGAFAESLPCYINLENTATMPPMVEDVFVDLSTRQRKLYDDFEKKGVVWLDEHPMIADVPIVQRIRLRQIALAECSIEQVMAPDGEQDKVVFLPNAKSSKFEVLKEMLADLPDEKVVIATDSAKFARMVAARLGSDAFPWTGEKTQKERDVAKERFTKGKLKYLVATQASISEGTDGLQHVSHILIILSENDNPVQNSQMIGRLNRTGQAKRVLVYRVRARNTIEDRQAATLLGKAISMRESMLKNREEEIAA